MLGGNDKRRNGLRNAAASRELRDALDKMIRDACGKGVYGKFLLEFSAANGIIQRDFGTEFKRSHKVPDPGPEGDMPVSTEPPHGEG